MKTVSLLLFFIIFSTYALAQTGYSSTPWGSKTWTGPGRPPHWTSPQPEKKAEKHRAEKKNEYAKHKKPGKYHNHHHKHNKKRYILVTEKEPVYYPPKINQKTVIRTRYVPVQRKTPANLCSGDTVYLRDKNSGEITIRYVSAAQSCK